MTTSDVSTTPRFVPRIASHLSSDKPLPKAPVLGWNSFWPPRASSLPSVAGLPHLVTTSGRAALLAALQQARLPPGSFVLVPTYHCPTMVAPVVLAGLRPIYFALDDQGLPLLDSITPAMAAQARAMFVAQYFGLPKGLHAVQAWCLERGIVMVEDCAHSYFGLAGDRPVGSWGDYAIASVSKFFPVAEAGLLASRHLPLQPLRLRAAGLRLQLKSALDVLQNSYNHGELVGLSALAAPLAWRHPGGAAEPPSPAGGVLSASAAETMVSADMGRVEQSATVAARLLLRLLPEQPIVERRRTHYRAWHAALAGVVGGRAQVPALPHHCAPYVYPLWVDGAERADHVYAALRQARLPVFRWDRVWPGTPAEAGDTGMLWSRHLLQLLCHQSLSAGDIERSAQVLRQALQAH